MDLPCADIVITDFNMPNMNGVELLKLQHDRGCAAQVENKAVMSAAITTQVKDEVDNLGCHFLEKPFKRADIKQWLEECAERIHSADGQH
jgi:YesN/AraC family two-component response regulator